MSIHAWKAIETKYLPATDTKGSRIKAYHEGGMSVTIPYPHELSGADCYWEAARKLIERMGWTGTDWYVGGTKGGYVFVAGHEDAKVRP